MRLRLNSWYSSRPPDALWIVAGFLAVSGTLVLARSAGRIAGRVISDSAAGMVEPDRVIVELISGALGVLWLSSGVLLWRRRKLGASLALASVAVEAARLAAEGRPTVTGALFLLAIVVMVAVSWRALEGFQKGIP